MSPSVDHVRLYLSAPVGNSGSAPTRMRTASIFSNCLVRCCATMEMNPGARPQHAVHDWMLTPEYLQSIVVAPHRFPVVADQAFIRVSGKRHPVRAVEQARGPCRQRGTFAWAGNRRQRLAEVEQHVVAVVR